VYYKLHILISTNLIARALVINAIKLIIKFR